MKYYSDLTQKFYESEQECKAAEDKALAAQKKAEEAAAKKSQERKARAEEIDASFNRMKAAQEEYRKLLYAFVKDYGSYHKSYSVDGLKDWLTDFWAL